MKNVYFKSPRRSDLNVIISPHMVLRYPAAISHPSTSFKTSACLIIVRVILIWAITNYVCKNILSEWSSERKNMKMWFFRLEINEPSALLLTLQNGYQFLNIHISKCFGFHFKTMSPVDVLTGSGRYHCKCLARLPCVPHLNFPQSISLPVLPLHISWVLCESSIFSDTRRRKTMFRLIFIF